MRKQVECCDYCGEPESKQNILRLCDEGHAWCQAHGSCLKCREDITQPKAFNEYEEWISKRIEWIIRDLKYKAPEQEEQFLRGHLRIFAKDIIRWMRVGGSDEGQQALDELQGLVDLAAKRKRDGDPRQ